MSDTNTGGNNPAFPVHDETHMYPTSTGITIRDYFAAHALVGMLANGNDLLFDDLADTAYLIAKQMVVSKFCADNPDEWDRSEDVE